jgi:hypothetical protein
MALHATAELEELGNAFQVSDLRGSFASTYRLDSHLDLGASADISVSREEPGSANLASNVSEAPLTIASTGSLSATRHFGRLDATLRGNLERNVYGDTTFSDGTTRANTDQNRWVYGGGLRLSHPITPILSAFADASVNRETYDAASPDLLVKLDGNAYALRGGLSGQWNGRAEAQASIGYGLRTFDEAGLAPVHAALYDASVTLHPSPTLQLDAGFSTAIRPPGTNGSGTAELLYSASGRARYTVNDWLALRVSATWYDGTFADSADFERGYSAGIGLDYALSRHTKLTADYEFAHDQASPNTPTDTHTVLLGVSLSR